MTDDFIREGLRKGEAFFAGGRIDQAERCFLDLLEQTPSNKEAINNLGVIAFHRGDDKAAVDFFSRVLSLDPFHIDAIMNLSAILKKGNRLHDAVPFLEKAIQRFPEDKQLRALLEDAVSAGTDSRKIAVLCLPGLESFLGDIVNDLKTRYEVRTCYSNQMAEISKAVQWADTVWLEWANDLSVSLTNHPLLLKNRHVICRLHSYEAFGNFIHAINWSRVHDLIFVSSKVRDIALEQNPGISDQVKKVHVIPNGVFLEKYHLINRPKGKNLAYLGYINYKKGPLLLLHAFKALHDHGPTYRLFIGGKFQDLRYQYYFNEFVAENNLQENIFFDGWVQDVDSWLRDKHYILCTSLFEGHPVGVMEAMAAGLKPLIHNFPGAEKIYPREYLWMNIQDLINMVTKGDYSPAKYRSYIEENYSFDKQIEKIHTLLSDIDAPLSIPIPSGEISPPAVSPGHTVTLRNPAPRVSVIIPAYNAESYIEKAVSSVFDQTYSNWELIIVDDGSTDQTKKVIKPFLRDERVRYFFKENGGEASARNMGLKHAHSAFIAWLDADDFFEAGYLEKAVTVLLENPDVLLVYPDFRLLDRGGKCIGYWRYKDYDLPDLVRDLFRTGHSVVPGAVSIVARAAVYKKLGDFDTEFRISTDYEYLSRIGKLNGRVAALGEPLYNYLVRDDSLSSNTREKFEFCCRVMERMIDRYPFYILFPEFSERALDTDGLDMLRISAFEQVFSRHVADKLQPDTVEPFLIRKMKYARLLEKKIMDHVEKGPE